MDEINNFFFRSGIINCVVSFSGEILHTNNEWKNLLGIDSKSVLGKGYLKHIHPDDQSDTMLTAIHLTGGKNLFNYKNRYLNSKGEYVVINWNATIDEKKKRIFSSGLPEISPNKDTNFYSFENPDLNKSFLDSIPSLVWATDNNCSLYYVNKSWVEFSGINVENAIKDWHSSFDSSDLRAFKSKLAESTKKHKEFFMECRLRNKNNHTLWFNISAKPRYLNNGEFAGMVGTANIIESLKITANRLIQASEIASLGIWELNLKTNEVQWDNIMYKLYEVDTSVKEINYGTWKNSVLPEDIEEAEEALRLCKESHYDQAFSFRIKTKNGNIKYISAVVTLITDENDTPIKMAGINYDITEQRSEEIFLKKLHEIYTEKSFSLKPKLQLILETTSNYLGLSIGIISKIDNEDYRIVISHSPNNELKSGQVFELGKTYCHETVKKNKVNYYINAENSEISSLPCFHSQKLNTYIGIPLYVDNKLYGTLCFCRKESLPEGFSSRQISFFCLVSRIIEKMLENENYLETLRKRNEQLDSFAHIASHDLKEPLRSLNNYTQFLLEDYNDILNDDGKKYISIIQWQAKHIKELIDDMLEFTQASHANNIEVNVSLDSLIKDLSKSTSYSFPEKDILIKIENPLGNLRIDEKNIAIIYRNLITNSIKYNENDEIRINIGSYYDNKKDKNVFYVKDNGIGIDKEYHHQIFSLFKRLHSKKKYGGGTGLGLAIVKKIIEEKNGQIWLESSKGIGSSFFFHF